ncbi:MAG TPA: tripartite tricarboxylate transporter substrate binding protein [Rubrivivax sp.]|nr:tripartite tricarboxylate transporter substrate binding protein [Rubrivivax sp.]
MNLKAFVTSALLAATATAGAQSYPSKPITVVVPAPPGGIVDTLTRTMVEEMAKQMGQPLIVDNKPGASGVLAAQTVARAAPDGYTVLVTYSTPILNAPYMFKKLPYDVKRDFSYVSQLYTGQLVLAVNSQAVPAKNMREFVAWAEGNKGKVVYGSYGIGSSAHLIGAYLSQSKGLDMVHVPYKGEPPMLQDLIGGQIAWAVGSASSLQPHLDSGKLRALAVLGDKPIKELPKVPTMAQAGFPDVEYRTVGWIGMLAPAGLPAPIQARLEQESLAALQSTAMKARLQVAGMEPIGATGAQFRRDLEASLPVTEQLINVSGAKAE